MLKRLKVIEHYNSEINSTDAELIKCFGIVAVTSVSNDRVLKMSKSFVFKSLKTVYVNFVL